MRYIAYLRQLKKRKTPLICQLSHDCNRVHQIPAFLENIAIAVVITTYMTANTLNLTE